MDGAWRDAVAGCADAGLAHAPEWFTAISAVYGHTPLYLAANHGAESGVLPAFVVERPLLGPVVTSMPFLDSGGPCGSRQIAAALVERLTDEGRRRGARYVELRCGSRLAANVPALENKVNMTLALDPDPDVMWKRFDKSVRNQIRKAERSGLSIDAGGLANLAPFYDAFAERMRDLGSPVHAFAFLKAVVEAFGRQARVMLVKKGSVPIGGLVALSFNDRVVVPWATCRQEYFALCPNMLLYWDTIRRASTDGFKRFEFGRSSRDSGTYRFKRQWGAREEPLYWYRLPTNGTNRHVPVVNGTGTRAIAEVWRRLPLGVTRRVGPHIRRYLIQ